MTKMPKLPIYEEFYTFQGEGNYAGLAAYFIRTYGCPLHCDWCDSAGTWHPGFRPREEIKTDIEGLAQRAINSAAQRCVITGGEPAIHDLRLLTTRLREGGMSVHLETSGSYPLRGSFDWVTVSPKWSKEPLGVNVKTASEIKIIVDRPRAVDHWMKFLQPNLRHDVPIWLHPEWSLREDPNILAQIIDTVKSNPQINFRAGFQIHKLYRVDQRDAGSRVDVPLGGKTFPTEQIHAAGTMLARDVPDLWPRSI